MALTLKFPRTHHVHNMGAATTDDLVLDAAACKELLVQKLILGELGLWPCDSSPL